MSLRHMEEYHVPTSFWRLPYLILPRERVVGTQLIPITGNPIKKRTLTNLVERQNLTVRMNMRRFTRLTNAFSRRFSSLETALSLHFFHDNFMRIHQSLRVTPAMEAKISSHVWSWNELLNHQTQSQAA